MTDKYCNKCNVEFQTGESWITALDKEWHKHCFVCDYCGHVFDKEISLYKGKFPMHPHCERTKEIDDADKCTKCNKPLLPGKPIVEVGNKGQYHTTCFVCTKCSKPFENGSYVSENDKPYHPQCIGMTSTSGGSSGGESSGKSKRQEIAKTAMNNLDERCQTCGEEILGPRKVNELGHFHPNCFICNTCQTSITTGSYAIHPTTNKPLCSNCLQSLTTCDTCNKSIKGNTFYKHPKTDLPMCESCMKQVTTATAKK